MIRREIRSQVDPSPIRQRPNNIALNEYDMDFEDIDVGNGLSPVPHRNDGFKHTRDSSQGANQNFTFLRPMSNHNRSASGKPTTFLEKKKPLPLKIIVLAGDAATVTNQKIEKEKFNQIVDEVYRIPKHVSSLIFSNNVFKFNAIAAFKMMVKNPLPCVLHFD